MFGVEVPDTGGRAGMAAIKLRDGVEFDGKALAETVYGNCPATPCRCSSGSSSRWRPPRRSRAARSTCASRPTAALRRRREAEKIEDPLYVLAGRDEGYVPFYDEYPEEVADGKRPEIAIFGANQRAMTCE